MTYTISNRDAAIADSAMEQDDKDLVDMQAERSIDRANALSARKHRERAADYERRRKIAWQLLAMDCLARAQGKFADDDGDEISRAALELAAVTRHRLIAEKEEALRVRR